MTAATLVCREVSLTRGVRLRRGARTRLPHGAWGSPARCPFPPQALQSVLALSSRSFFRLSRPNKCEGLMGYLPSAAVAAFAFPLERGKPNEAGLDAVRD
jgi:hypothetical protein